MYRLEFGPALPKLELSRREKRAIADKLNYERQRSEPSTVTRDEVPSLRTKRLDRLAKMLGVSRTRTHRGCADENEVIAM